MPITALLKIQCHFSSRTLLPAPKWILLLLDDKKYADTTSKADSGIAKQALLETTNSLARAPHDRAVSLTWIWFPHTLFTLDI